MPSDAEIAAEVREWNRHRLAALDFKRERNAEDCDETYSLHEYEPEVDTGEWKPCWREKSDQAEWCESCRRRDRCHRAYVEHAKARNAVMRRIQRMVK